MKFFDWHFLPSELEREDQALLDGIISIAAEVGLFRQEQDIANGE